MSKLGLQHYKFDMTILNGMMTTLGIAGAVGPVWGSIANSVNNSLSICMDIAQDSLEKGVKVTPAMVWMRLVRALGPLLGMPDSAFVTLVAATALLGISAVGVFLAVAAGPVEIAIAALGLFFDALAYGAADGGFTVSQHKAAVDIGNRRRLEMYLEQQFRKQQSARPQLRMPVWR